MQSRGALRTARLLRHFARTCLLAALVACVADPTTAAAFAGDSAPALQQAVAQIQKRNLSEAARILQTAIREDPANADGRFLMGIVLTEQGRLSEANTYFVEARRLKSALHVALRAQAMNEFNLRRLDQAEAHFREFLEATPGDEISYLFLSKIALAQGRDDAAWDFLNRAPRLLSTDPGAQLLSAELHLKLGREPEAEQLLNGLAGAGPQAAFEAGSLWMKYGAYGKAIPWLSRALDTDPNLAPAQYNLALAYFQTGSFEKAQALLTPLSEGTKPDFDVINLLADTYARLGRLDDALGLRNKILALYPREPKAYVSLVLLCVEAVRYDLGLQIAEKGLKVSPHSVSFLILRAWLNTLTGQTNEANADYRRAIQLEPGNDWLRVGLAASLIDGWRPQEALPILRKLSAGGKGDYFVCHLLGDALLQSGAAPNSPQESEALAALQKSVSLAPTFWPARINLAKLYRQRAAPDDALAELREVTRQDPQNTSAHYLMAQIYRETGRAREADETLQIVTRLNAERDSAQVTTSHKVVAMRSVLTKALER